MKSKSALVLVCVLVFCALLALILVPAVRVMKNNPHKVIAYIDGVPVDPPDENTLVLTVQYDTDDGSFYEMDQSPIVATDSSFAAPLRMQISHNNDGGVSCWYNCENAAEVEKIYVKPPTFYERVETETVPIPLKVGQIMKQSAGETDSESAGQDWFSIRSLNVREIEDSLWQASVYVDALAAVAPRMAQLQIDGEEYGGTSSLNFSGSGWDSCTFTFLIPSDSAEDALSQLSSAAFCVTGALLRAEPANLHISSGNAEVILVRGEE